MEIQILVVLRLWREMRDLKCGCHNAKKAADNRPPLQAINNKKCQNPAQGWLLLWLTQQVHHPKRVTPQATFTQNA